MKKMITFLLILTLLAMATSAAATSKEPVGDRIIVFGGGSTTFPAGAPFHIRHGWVNDSNTDGIGIFDFELEIDGVLREEDFVMRSAESGDPDILIRFWVHNFPNGMTGTHTFTGHWLGPCQPLVDMGFIPGPCTKPNAKVEALSRTLTVTFVP